MAEKTSWDAAALLETDINTYLAHTGSAWTTYTPTFGNTTLGNGTKAGAYHKAGRKVVFRAKFTLGSTSAVGTSPNVSLPFTAANQVRGQVLAWFYDNSANTIYVGFVEIDSTTAPTIMVQIASTTYTTVGGITATLPFTWATSDTIEVVGVYESTS